VRDISRPTSTARSLPAISSRLARFAAELPRPLSLDEALAVLVLIAEREPATFPRAAARFAGRLALERAMTITEVEHAAATLVDLPAATAYAELGEICERHGIRPPRPARSS
jgi:hypothetical protein